MKRPSKFRVLLAVNRWRITHGKAPILRLPKGNMAAAKACPLKYALGVDEVWQTIWSEGDEGGVITPPILFTFAQAFDAGLYPELIL